MMQHNQTSSRMDKTYLVVTTGCDKFYITMVMHISKKNMSHNMSHTVLNLYSQVSLLLLFVDVCLQEFLEQEFFEKSASISPLQVLLKTLTELFLILIQINVFFS